MIAKCLYENKEINVEQASDLVKFVIPYADYIFDDKFVNHTLVLFKSEDKISKIKKELLYSFYLINGELYDSLYTNSLKELEKFEKLGVFKKTGNEQLKLF
ncbi:MAG: hypothetical protein RSE50_12725 [Myroides sp.]